MVFEVPVAHTLPLFWNVLDPPLSGEPKAYFGYIRCYILGLFAIPKAALSVLKVYL